MSDSTSHPDDDVSLIAAAPEPSAIVTQLDEPPRPPAPAPLNALDSLRLRTHRWFAQHGHALWWLHSAYAFSLGMIVVFFARKGYDHARWLAVSVGLAWLLVVFFFRVFGSGTREQHNATSASGGKLRFVVMTYVLKNLYQGMLFFLLPFYWQSATLDSPHAWFLCVLCVCAILSTIDVVFDRYVMRWRALASLFHAFILFGTLALILPAFLPRLSSLVTLCIASGVSAAAFWTLHVPFALFRDKLFLFVFAGSIALASAGGAAIRTAIPPVPIRLVHGAVGPSLLADGRLTMEVERVHRSVLHTIVAVTDIDVPAGRNTLVHVWRRNGREVYRATGRALVEHPQRAHARRLESSLPASVLEGDLVGDWWVDVETTDRQLVGRVRFSVDR